MMCLSHHIILKHKIKVKKYYDDFLRKDINEGKCLNCGKNTSCGIILQYHGKWLNM